MKSLLTAIFFLLVLAKIFPILSPVWNAKETFQVDLARNLARQNLNIFKGQINFIPEHVKEAGLNLTPPYPWTEDFPLFNLLAASLMKMTNSESLFVGRFLSLAFFLLGCFFLFKFVKKEFGESQGQWCIVLLAMTPIMFTFSTQFMADMAMICCFIAALYFLQQYALTPKKKYFYCALLAAVTIPSFRYYGAFLLIPLLGYWLDKKLKFNFKFLIFFIAPAIIPALWLYYSLNLQNNPITLHETHENWHWGYWKSYLIDNTFYYQIMFDRFFRYSLTYVALPFFIFGLIKLRKSFFMWGYIASLLLSCGIFNIGHHIHEYYQMKFIPLLALLAAVGMVESLKFIKNKRWGYVLQICVIVASFILSACQGYKLLKFDSSGTRLGEELKNIIQPQERVLAIQDVPDPGVFIYGNAQGWITNTDFIKNKSTVRTDINKVVIRVQASPENLDFLISQGFKEVWSFEGNLGLHTKCGAWHFFFGECKRSATYLKIFTRWAE
ncbi:MAG TPA: glycosyltransferase family 39 protein [Bdellovibrionota bacterium]|nr:glycosyltransferase family 39 protein [Bdellovibrionota bacterium]